MPVAQKVLMIRPATFAFNQETAKSNRFQNQVASVNIDNVLIEFDKVVEGLRNGGIQVELMQDTLVPKKPDAIFPNNWLSTTSNNHLFIYPMLTSNRRAEVREDIIKHLSSDYSSLIDLRRQKGILEGTGSLVIDWQNKTVFACISQRTDEKLAEYWSNKMAFDLFLFDAVDDSDVPIYHTNVMMSVSDKIAVVCLKSVKSDSERQQLLKCLSINDRIVLELSMDQMNRFCANVLVLKSSSEGKEYFCCSTSAYEAFDSDQKRCIEQFYDFLVFNVQTIEKVGGGGLRCMLAELW